MAVYQIDPLRDPRWEAFLAAHPRASVFHTSSWLECLQRTYGYEPFVLTTSAPGSDLTNGLVFCRVKSFLSGDRLVSVPFADHCDPLFERVEDVHSMLDWLGHKLGPGAGKQVELRPRNGAALGLTEHTQFRAGQQFHLHVLDLRPELEQIAGAFDRDSVQRRLRRVARHDLIYEEGNSPGLLKKFYRLQVLTRRRHQLPPQPLQWFSNLLALLGDRAKIRVVSTADQPVASILTLTYNQAVTYKYGCSDARHNRLAGTTFLLWAAIREAKGSRAHTFDMGRSDMDNRGLIAFKSHWGAADVPLTYWQYPASSASPSQLWSKGKRAGGYVASMLPDFLLVLLGRVLYRHMG
jgi:Acetyltransferase (GNAT) domain